MARIFTGSDYSTFRPDGTYGLTYVRIYGSRVPLEGVARRWLTTNGDLFWSPNAGFNVSRLENASATPQILKRYASFLVVQAKAVDFVYSATVSVTYVGTTLLVVGSIVLADFTTHPLLVTAAEAATVTTQFPSSPLPATS